MEGERQPLFVSNRTYFKFGDGWYLGGSLGKIGGCISTLQKCLLR